MGSELLDSDSSRFTSGVLALITLGKNTVQSKSVNIMYLLPLNCLIGVEITKPRM
jgi:hypothetical protein